MNRYNRTISRILAATRPIDPEELRADWEQSFDLIPDFDLSGFDEESEMESGECLLMAEG